MKPTMKTPRTRGLTPTSTEALKASLEGSDTFKSFLEDRGEILKLIKVAEFLQGFNDRMELQQVLTVLYCFYLGDAERTPKNLRETMELPSSTVSRNLAAISDIGIRGKPGYRWCTLETDMEQRNRKLVVMTSRGNKIRKMLSNIMRGLI